MALGRCAGGANAICLHSSPQQLPGANAVADGDSALLYGTEYQDTGTLDKNEDKDAACAVCMVQKAGHTYVQWGRSLGCGNDHETLYSGLVMASKYSHRKSTFVCVDLLRDAHPASSDTNHNGATLYTTEARAGSMNSDEYTHNVEVGCSVCLAPRTVYNHWGSRECPSTASLLYHGTLASGAYDQAGSQFPIMSFPPPPPPPSLSCICIYVYICMCSHTHLNVCVHTHVCVCVCLCVRACVRACVCVCARARKIQV